MQETKWVSRTQLIKEIGVPECIVDRVLHSRYASEVAYKSKGSSGKWVINLKKFEEYADFI